MKKIFGVVIAFLLIIILLPACGGGAGPDGGGEPSTGPDGDDNIGGYTGFMSLAAGQWAEYVMTGGGEEFRQKMENIGQDTIDGKSCTGFEMTMSDPQEGEIVVQMWADAANQQPVKYVMKMEGAVICMGIGQSPYEPPETETPGDYDPSLPGISYGTYTTPGSGKTVNVAIFKVADQGEAWVSSEVPFGIVQVLDASGTSVIYLYDFAQSGAHRDISKAEMENCMEIPGF